jgi:GcrA cell cycle regulator
MGQPFEWTDEIAGTVEFLWKRGYSATAITTEINAPSRNAVLGYMNRNRARFPKRNGIKDNDSLVEESKTKNKMTVELLQKASGLWHENHKLESIAEAIGYSYSGMKGVVKRYSAYFPKRNIHAVNIKAASQPFKPLYRHTDKIFGSSAPVAFIDLSPNQCKWILSDVDDHEGPHSPCCGGQRLKGSAYCSEHYRLSRGPGTHMEQRAHQAPNLRRYR